MSTIFQHMSGAMRDDPQPDHWVLDTWSIHARRIDVVHIHIDGELVNHSRLIFHVYMTSMRAHLHAVIDLVKAVSTSEELIESANIMYYRFFNDALKVQQHIYDQRKRELLLRKKCIPDIARYVMEFLPIVGMYVHGPFSNTWMVPYYNYMLTAAPRRLFRHLDIMTVRLTGYIYSAPTIEYHSRCVYCDSIKIRSYLLPYRDQRIPTSLCIACAYFYLMVSEPWTYST